MDVIKEILSLKKRHYYCEDSWYSCPLAEDGCCDDSVDKNKCRCGADIQHEKVDAIIEELHRLGIGVEQHSLQQLKAKIRAISDIIVEYGESGIAVDFSMLKRRLRELSAV